MRANLTSTLWRVTVTEDFAASATGSSPHSVARSWNLTFADLSDQAPLVPLYKQPEVQECECAADRGFLSLRFPAPWPSGSRFSSKRHQSSQKM